jgi:hypothetical protein
VPTWPERPAGDVGAVGNLKNIGEAFLVALRHRNFGGAPRSSMGEGLTHCVDHRSSLRPPSPGAPSLDEQTVHCAVRRLDERSDLVIAPQ